MTRWSQASKPRHLTPVSSAVAASAGGEKLTVHPRPGTGGTGAGPPLQCACAGLRRRQAEQSQRSGRAPPEKKWKGPGEPAQSPADSA